MKPSLYFVRACLAAGLSGPVVFAQATTPPPPPTPPPARARSAEVVVQRGYTYLGIGGAEITPERAKALNLKEERGVEVTRVEDDSPASRAGLKQGDVIVDFNSTPVQGTEQLTRLIRETPSGRQVRLMVWRNGATQTLTATVESHKGTMVNGPWVWPEVNVPMPEINIPKFQMTYGSPILGIQGEALGQESQLAEYFGVKDGVLVRSVSQGSAAEKAGIKAGDVIVKVEDTYVSNSQEITRTLRNLPSRSSFTVTLVRNKKEMPLPVTLENPGGRVRANGRQHWIAPEAFDQLDFFPNYEEPLSFWQW